MHSFPLYSHCHGWSCIHELHVIERGETGWGNPGHWKGGIPPLHFVRTLRNRFRSHWHWCWGIYWLCIIEGGETDASTVKYTYMIIVNSLFIVHVESTWRSNDTKWGCLIQRVDKANGGLLKMSTQPRLCISWFLGGHLWVKSMDCSGWYWHALEFFPCK